MDKEVIKSEIVEEREEFVNGNFHVVGNLSLRQLSR